MTELRASDADRQRVVLALERHHEDGRLTLEELEERTEAAWRAKLVSELATLMSDLPSEPAPAVPAVPAPPERRPPRWPGRVPFAVRHRAPVPRERAMVDLLDHLAPALRAAGFDLVERTAERAVFARRRIPLWTVPIVVLTFPFGLLALLIRTEDRIEVDLVPDDGGTLLYAQGRGPLAIRRAFAQLET
jgi:hypothetical protein